MLKRIDWNPWIGLVILLVSVNLFVYMSVILISHGVNAWQDSQNQKTALGLACANAGYPNYKYIGRDAFCTNGIEIIPVPTE